MANLVFGRRQFLVLSSSALVIASPEIGYASSNALAVVVGVHSPQRTLSLDELRRIFLNKDTNGDSGERFVPVNQRSGSPDRIRFDTQVLKLAPDQVARYWIDQRLRGKRAPSAVGSLPMLKRALHELPGAISYMAVADLDSSLRALNIDGQNPSDASYPLR